MLKEIILKAKNIFSKQEKTLTEKTASNKGILFGQVKTLMGVLIGAVFVLGVIVTLTQKKVKEHEPLIETSQLKHELPDKVIDPDKGWRNHFDDELKKTTISFNEKLEEAAKLAEDEKKKLREKMEVELSGLRQQLEIARKELLEGTLSLKEVSRKEQERLESAPVHTGATLDIQEFGDEVEYDVPKPASEYVPEGTYFTGYLQHGLVVSTALNNAEEPVQVTIRLTERGNLPMENKTNISKCRIVGSTRGDLSSERAEVRLEKLVCQDKGMVFTSQIAGNVVGGDGFNGIKGTVVSTGSKHIKNAMLGGLISGLSSSAKGQEGLNLTAAGALSTKAMGFKDMAKTGALTGAGNAGEKLADHYLRYAESMSPVLTIPGGARVNVVIREGFFMGQVNTHRKIASQREKNRKVSGNSGEVKNDKEAADGNW